MDALPIITVFALWIGGAIVVGRYLDFQLGFWWFVLGMGPVAAYFS